jgi:hypothetical protein
VYYRGIELRLNSVLLGQAVNGIPYAKNTLDFQSRSRITNFATAVDVLRFLNRKGIGKMSGNQVSFSQIDKLSILLLALKSGCDPKPLSSKLDWRDFEAFTALILEQSGYVCTRNFIITKPRIQIDVIARLNRTALVIDCKHWKKMSRKKMIECANKQYIRTERYMKLDKDIRSAIPVIVTLYEYFRSSKNNLLFVPISKFRSFLTEYILHQDQLPYVSFD